jgi:hypothetical protein
MTTGPSGDSVQRVRTVGEKVAERSRERRAAARDEARRRGDDPIHPSASPPTPHEAAQVAGRIAVFAIVVVLAFVMLRRITYVAFAPDLEVVRAVVPDTGIAAGAPVTMGVVVRNRGPQAGASFVVAVSGDTEVEGPTVTVPPRDSAWVPVHLTLDAGGNAVSLVVFDGWRGVRRLRSFRDLPVVVERRVFDVQAPDQAERGQSLKVSLSWSNLGVASARVVPVVVLRPIEGGYPLETKGPDFELAPAESRVLEFTLDSWVLRPGRYSMDVFLESPGRERVAQATSPRSLEVTER